MFDWRPSPSPISLIQVRGDFFSLKTQNYVITGERQYFPGLITGWPLGRNGWSWEDVWVTLKVLGGTSS